MLAPRNGASRGANGNVKERTEIVELEADMESTAVWYVSSRDQVRFAPLRKLYQGSLLCRSGLCRKLAELVRLLADARRAAAAAGGVRRMPRDTMDAPVVSL